MNRVGCVAVVAAVVIGVPGCFNPLLGEGPLLKIRPGTTTRAQVRWLLVGILYREGDDSITTGAMVFPYPGVAKNLEIYFDPDGVVRRFSLAQHISGSRARWSWLGTDRTEPIVRFVYGQVDLDTVVAKLGSPATIEADRSRYYVSYNYDVGGKSRQARWQIWGLGFDDTRRLTRIRPPRNVPVRPLASEDVARRVEVGRTTKGDLYRLFGRPAQLGRPTWGYPIQGALADTRNQILFSFDAGGRVAKIAYPPASPAPTSAPAAH